MIDCKIQLLKKRRPVLWSNFHDIQRAGCGQAGGADLLREPYFQKVSVGAHVQNTHLVWAMPRKQEISILWCWSGAGGLISEHTFDQHALIRKLGKLSDEHSAVKDAIRELLGL